MTARINLHSSAIQLTAQDYRNYLTHDPKHIQAKEKITREYTWIGRLNTWAGDDLLKKICVIAAYVFAAAHDYIKRDKTAHLIYCENLSTNSHFQYHKGMNDFEQAAAASAISTNISHPYLEKEALKDIQKKYGVENVILTPIFYGKSKKIDDNSIRFTCDYRINIRKANGELVELGTLALKADFNHFYKEGTLVFEYTWNQARLTEAQKVSDTFEDLPPLSGDALRKQYRGVIPPKETMLTHLAKSHIESHYKIECTLSAIRYEKSEHNLAFTKYRKFSCDILDRGGKKIGTYTSNSQFYYETGVGREIPAGTEIPLDKVSRAPVGPDGTLVPILPGSEKLNNAQVEFTVTFDNRVELAKLQTDLRNRQINKLVLDHLL